ncbi:MAG TPA: DUF4199 domain-containing protein [Candidatus Paceibacterota bacterium]
MTIFSRNHWNYALILSCFTIACLVLMETSGNNQSFNSGAWYQVLFMTIAPAVVLFLGIRTKRAILDGVMSFKQGFREGMMISLLFGIISAFVFLAYYKWFNSGILESVRIAYRMQSASETKLILTDMGLQVVFAVVFGAIVSSVSSFILKRSKKQ